MQEHLNRIISFFVVHPWTFVIMAGAIWYTVKLLRKWDLPASPSGDWKHNYALGAFIWGVGLTAGVMYYITYTEGGREFAKAVGLEGPKPNTPTAGMVVREGNGEYRLQPPTEGHWAVYHEGSASNGKPIHDTTYKIPPKENPPSVAFYIVVGTRKSNPILLPGRQ